MHEQDGAWPSASDAPICDGLVAERGHIPAGVNRMAAQILHETGRTMGFASVRATAF
ncbi:hypothetical protein [Streptomyces sp. NPDC101165]|uniref:hypothetical protein n=1 Tax=Streptomyces sp. NPDC101165 TaxID=3366119 RepID=UPI0038082B8E